MVKKMLSRLQVKKKLGDFVIESFENIIDFEF